MTVSQCIDEFKKELHSLYERSELDQLQARVFEKVCGLSKIDLVVKKDFPVGDKAYGELRNILARLKTNEPLQYVLGEAWFMGMRFEVNKHVLIPRPETEELVAWVIQELTVHRGAVLRILDACTGSGCIAVSLKQNFPAATVIAYDKSLQALSIARRNAELHKVEIEFLQDDAIHPKKFAPGEEFDVVISNPPYIGVDEFLDIPGRVKDFEPMDALFTRHSDPLIFYRSLADFAVNHLSRKGILFFEINQKAGMEISNLLEGKGFKEMELRKDLSSANRMIKAKSPNFES